LIRSVYITREPEAVPHLRLFCEKNGIKLTAISQIAFTPCDFQVEQPFEVVFFSSPRSVDFFLKAHILESNVAVACVGKGTASYLEKKGIAAAFIGENPGNPAQNALDFATWLGKRSVLFPVSSISKGSMLQAHSPDQVQQIVVYETHLTPVEISENEVYVFTSPSNVHSFLLKNEIHGAKIIAWGKSTEKELLKNHLQATSVLQSSAEQELISLLERVTQN